MFCYRLNGMGAQKNAPKKLFMYIFHAYFIQNLNKLVYEYFRNKYALLSLVTFAQF